MHTRFLILFSIVLHSLYVNSEVRKRSKNFLPFVMVNHKYNLELPTQLDNANINEFLGFIGDIQFSKDNSKDQMFFCPINSVTQVNHIKDTNLVVSNSFFLQGRYDMGVSGDCLFREKFEKGMALRCSGDAIPSIGQLKSEGAWDNLIQFCGPREEGILYEFFYEICSPAITFYRLQRFIGYQSDFGKFSRHFQYEHYIVYEICYDYKNNNTIYTKHTLKSVDLLFDERLKNEREKEYSMMIDGYENFEPYFQKFQNSYYQDRILKNSKGIRESSKEAGIYDYVSDDIYMAEKLVPSDDMITALLRKPTFHYINIKPMHRNLQKIWNYIGELIRENFRNEKTENDLEIYTGAFISPDPDHHLPEYWPDGVPQVWIKLLLLRKKKDYPIGSTLVVIMKNENTLEEGTFNFKPALNKLCPENNCEFFKHDKATLEKFGDLVNKIQCCPFSEVINSAFFKINFIFGGQLLHINNLTYQKEN